MLEAKTSRFEVFFPFVNGFGLWIVENNKTSSKEALFSPQHFIRISAVADVYTN